VVGEDTIKQRNRGKSGTFLLPDWELEDIWQNGHRHSIQRIK
jgi:hypothetical protein